MTKTLPATITVDYTAFRKQQKHFFVPPAISFGSIAVASTGATVNTSSRGDSLSINTASALIPDYILRSTPHPPLATLGKPG